jgi:hypothetical protein
MHEVVNAHYVKDYILEIEFEDGRRKTVDLKSRLYGKVFEPLQNIEQFKNFKIDKQLGTIVWETGADFCPDALYAYM